MGDSIPHRTLQYRLRYLAEQGRVVTEGQRRGMKYLPASAAVGTATEAEVLSLSQAAQDIRKNVSRPILSRKLVGYNRDFWIPIDRTKVRIFPKRSASDFVKLAQSKLDSSRQAHTRETFWIDCSLLSLGIQAVWKAIHIAFWTKRLIAFGKEAQGKDRVEAQMIL